MYYLCHLCRTSLCQEIIHNILISLEEQSVTTCHVFLWQLNLVIDLKTITLARIAFLCLSLRCGEQLLKLLLITEVAHHKNKLLTSCYNIATNTSILPLRKISCYFLVTGKGPHTFAWGLSVGKLQSCFRVTQ